MSCSPFKSAPSRSAKNCKKVPGAGVTTGAGVTNCSFPPIRHPRRSFGRSINSHSLGRQPKGQFRLPINSHYPFPRVPEGSFECHSCLVMNYIANNRYPHNPKVEGSNPSPATKQEWKNIRGLIIPQGGIEGSNPSPATKQGWKNIRGLIIPQGGIEGSNPSPASNWLLPNQPYFVYVLWSERGRRFYVGLSEDPEKRLNQHNTAWSGWTARHQPWRLVNFKKCGNYREARKYEIELKAQKLGRGFFSRTGLRPEEYSRGS